LHGGVTEKVNAQDRGEEDSNAGMQRFTTLYNATQRYTTLHNACQIKKMGIYWYIGLPIQLQQ
jgi:hypothetical protein